MRKHIKNLAAAAMVMMVSASMLAGCGGTGTKTQAPAAGSTAAGASGDTTPAQSSEPMTLTFWRAGTDVETQTYWEEMIKRFEEKNPGVTVELSNLPWGDEIETKLNAAYASGTAPDVLQYSANSIPQRASVGQYAPLDDFVAEWDGKEDLFKSVLDSGKYEGKIYGLGMRPDARMFVWRKDMFQAAGLDPNTPPKTWEEVKEFADKLTVKKNGTTVQGGYSMSIANGFQDFQIYLTQNGGDCIDVNTMKLTYDSPEAIEALDFLNSLVQDGDVIPSDQFQSGTDAFVGGKAAMAYKNPSDIQGMIAADPSLADKIGMSAPLSRKKQSTFAGMGYMFMSQDSKNKDMALKFIEMAMSADEMKLRADQINIPPVRESLKEEYIKEKPEMNQAIMDSIQVGKGAYPVVFSNELNNKVSSAIEQVYYGKKTAKDALTESVTEFQKEIDAMK